VRAGSGRTASILTTMREGKPVMTEPAPIPAEDLDRRLTIATPDGSDVPRIAVAGGIYTILVSGEQTNGRYCLIDMLVPDGGGPPPHRHDFEELFTLLDGELEFTFRSETRTVAAPATINSPANAPHAFKNTSGKSAHLLCLCAPAGQEEFFKAVGVPVERRDGPPPQISTEERAEKGKLSKELAPLYRTELLA
jgi:quercetin dioxygenase-like cupin family protein